jgi:hypothetical protein
MTSWQKFDLSHKNVDMEAYQFDKNDFFGELSDQSNLKILQFSIVSHFKHCPWSSFFSSNVLI